MLKCYSTVLRKMTNNYLIKKPQVIVEHPALKTASILMRRSEEKLFPDMLSMSTQKSTWYETKDKKKSVIKEGQRCAQVGNYASLSVVMALAEVIQRPIYSIYPNVNYGLRDLFNQKIVPSNAMEGEQTLHVLWSKWGELDTQKGVKFTPNHFVPVVESM